MPIKLTGFASASSQPGCVHRPLTLLMALMLLSKVYLNGIIAAVAFTLDIFPSQIHTSLYKTDQLLY